MFDVVPTPKWCWVQSSCVYLDRANPIKDSTDASPAKYKSITVNSNRKGFRSKEETIKWISEFVETYNNEKHSGINFVTPNERHAGLEKEILQKKADVKYEAFLKNPIRFANGIEIYEVRNVRPLTPMTVAELKEYLEVNKITDVEGKPLKITENIPKKMRKKVKLA